MVTEQMRQFNGELIEEVQEYKIMRSAVQKMHLLVFFYICY